MIYRCQFTDLVAQFGKFPLVLRHDVAPAELRVVMQISGQLRNFKMGGRGDLIHRERKQVRVIRLEFNPASIGQHLLVAGKELM